MEVGLGRNLVMVIGGKVTEGNLDMGLGEWGSRGGVGGEEKRGGAE
jgi:hypothetical protein